MWYLSKEERKQIARVRVSQFLNKDTTPSAPSLGELIRRLEHFVRQYPQSRTGRALQSKEVSMNALAEAIRQTCKHAEVRSQEDAIKEWGEEGQSWYVSAWNADKQEVLDKSACIDASGASPESGKLITMAILGVPTQYIKQVEVLCEKLKDQGLLVHEEQGKKCISWRAPIKKDLIPTVDEIPVVATLQLNDAAELLWKGQTNFRIDGKMIRAVNAHSKHPCSFKIRPQKDKHSGKAGALAEFSHLLKMNGMNSAGITEIYRQHLLQQGIAVLEVQPEAGMQLEVKTKRRPQGQPNKRTFAAAGVDEIRQGREIDWIARCSSTDVLSTTLRMFEGDDRNGGSIHLGLMSEDEKILKWFTTQVSAITRVTRQHPIRLDFLPDALGAVPRRVTYEVLVKSKAQKGRFTREEAEQICDGEDLSMGMTIRGLRRIVASWKESAAEHIVKISSKEDVETNSWNGEHLVLSFSEKETAIDILRSFAPWDRAGKLLLLEPGSANIWEAIATEPPTEPLWAQVDLERIENEINIPEPEANVVLEDIYKVLEETVNQGQSAENQACKLRLDGAIVGLYDSLSSPGNACFPTLKEWAESSSATQDDDMQVLKSKIARVSEQHAWETVASRRRQGAFAKATGRGGEKQQKEFRTDLLFLALNKVVSTATLTYQGSVGSGDEIEFLLSKAEEEMGLEMEEESGNQEGEVASQL